MVTFYKLQQSLLSQQYDSHCDISFSTGSEPSTELIQREYFPLSLLQIIFILFCIIILISRYHVYVNLKIGLTVVVAVSISTIIFFRTKN
mmetsp:Transcript_16662/g.36010  ORF Transcript_16662/g.36010 Transcript_16662/m.36010 type:complete len:90 (+) Transcript_16662:2936-3205(+)